MDSRKRSALAVGLVLAIPLIAGLAWIGGRQQPRIRMAAPAAGDQEPGGSGSLSIGEIIVTDPLNGASQVEAQAVATWPGTEFPGIYSCSFVARDRSGQEVGRYEDIVASLSSPSSFPVKVEASSPASSMEGVCGPRLDTGTPYRYELSNVRVVSGVPTDGATRVGFDANWVGGGQAGAVTCRAAVMNEAGAVVGSNEFNLFLLVGSGTDLTTNVDVEGVPANAELDCSPFAG